MYNVKGATRSEILGNYQPILQLYDAFVSELVNFFQQKKCSDKVSYHLINAVDHLAAKQPDMFFRRWLRPKQRQKESENCTLIHLVAQKHSCI